MIPELQKFREKYPQYNDVPDSDLANSLADKYPESYSDLPAKLYGARDVVESGGSLDFSSPLAFGESVGEKLSVPVMQVPAAAIRSAIQGKGYAQGAMNPEQVPTFQDLAIQKTNDLLPEKTGVAGRFAAGVVPSAVGLAGDVATNPAMVLSMLLGKFPTGGGTNIAGKLAASPMGQATAKAMNTPITPKLIGENMRIPSVPPDASKIVPQIEKLTTEILQPSKLELQNNLNQGKQHPAVEQAAKVIVKSKDYSQLRKNIDGEIKAKFGGLREKYKQDNFEGDDSYLNPLRSKIQELDQDPQFSDVASEMKKVLSAEEKFLRLNEPKDISGPGIIYRGSESKLTTPYSPAGTKPYLVEDQPRTILQRTTTKTTPKDIQGRGEIIDRTAKPRKITRIEAQDRKEVLQDLTESLLNKRADGEVEITQPYRKQALDLIRQGLRKFVSGGDPEVDAINSTYEGLKEAKWLAAGQEALAQKKVPENLIQKIVGILRRDPASSVMEAAVQREQSLSKVTSQIEKLNKLLKSGKR